MEKRLSISTGALGVTLKLAFVGLLVAVALVTTNVKMGTPSAEAQSPYCAMNPQVCTPAYCATYPQICNPINPGVPIYPQTPCVYAGCFPAYNNCGPVPYPIYNTLYRPPCTYPLVYNNTACVYPFYGIGCNLPYPGGVPARINLAVSPAIATCGSTPVTVQATVTDAFGVPVANGTPVNFRSSIGGAAATASTIGGNATATLSIPAGVSPGVSSIIVTAGTATGSTSVQVNCPVPVVVQQQQVVVTRPAQATVIYRPGPPAPQQPVIIQRGPAPMAAPPFAPPRTGEAGLVDAILGPDGDEAANQALVDAWRDAEYGVLDASQYDWVVNPDDTDASIQLARDLLDQAYGVTDAAQADVVIAADDSAATTSLVVDVLSNPSDYGNA
jgi:hypothetical protein